MASNVQKMCDALAKTLDALKSLSRTHSGDLPEDVRAVLGKMAFDVNAALSAYVRNCDVGTAEEQADRFFDFCMGHTVMAGMCDTNCPCAGSKDGCHCVCKWEQLPYENEKGGAE